MHRDENEKEKEELEVSETFRSMFRDSSESLMAGYDEDMNSLLLAASFSHRFFTVRAGF